MKKLLSVLIALTIAPCAMAQVAKTNTKESTSFYLGVGVGVSDLGATRAAGITYTQDDNRDTHSKIFLGYQLNSLFALETSYHDLGKYKAAGSISGTAISANNEGTAWVVAAKLTPMSEQLVSPFIKLGAARLTAEETGDFGGTPFSAKKTKTNAYYAVGVDYEISKALTASVAYESFGKAGDDNDDNQPARIKPTAISVSITTRF